MGMIRILSEQDIEKLFTLKDAIAAVEEAYLQKQEGGGELWPMVFHEFEPGVADLDIKSGNLDSENIFGLKIVSWYGKNPEKNLPALFGTSMIFDLETGAPKAVLNAGAITDLRTGAAGAIGVKYLARKDSKKLVMAGCGALAPYLVAAALYVMPGIEEVTVINPHNPGKAEAELSAITEIVDRLLEKSDAQRTAVITANADAEHTVREADVIITATPSYEPMIAAEWVKEGTHISCVGADMSGKEEIDAEIFRNARVFGDDSRQCFSVGECEIPAKKGYITELDAEIGAVIADASAGRQTENEITIFDSTGIALQDLASAGKILKLAEEQGIGSVVEI
ncbi:MAG: ornithine cyclodeaminase family protein [Eubacteriales bacterium]|nr:ornithine cyclodeaminase family protein [Eubacteriales bacterium]